MIKNAKDFVWEQRYRPTTLDDYIATDRFKEKIKTLIKDDTSHLILESPVPGTGKTTIGLIIAKEISGDEVLFINASKDTGVDTIRDSVMNFVTRKAIFCERKTVIMDEVDQISTLAQDSLKSLLEMYYKHCRFIFTCNNFSKLSDPLKDRCTHINFMKIHGEPHTEERQQVAMNFFSFCQNILEENDIEYEDEDLVNIIKRNFKTVLRFRAVIRELYERSRSGKLDVSALYTDDGLDVSIVLNAVKMKNIDSIRQFAADHSNEWLLVLEELYTNFFEYFKKDSEEVYDISFAIQDYQDRLIRAYNKEITLTDFFMSLVDLKDALR